MRSLIRRKLAMAKRALDFSLANPATDPGHATLVTTLQELVQQGQALMLQQQDGYGVEHGAVMRRTELRETIRDSLRHLVAVARQLGEQDIQLASRFTQLDLTGPNNTFISAARLMVQNATASKELLISHGLGATLLDDVSKAITEFDSTVETAHTGRRGHVSASAALDAVSTEVMKVTRLLDGLNKARFKDDPAQLATWESARNVVGPFTVHEADATADPATAPVAVTKPDAPAAAA
jgi:hypothetical protein